MRKGRKKGFASMLIIAISLCCCSSNNKVEKEVNYDYFVQEESQNNQEHHHEEEGNYIHDEVNIVNIESPEKLNKEKQEQNQAILSELNRLSESIVLPEIEGDLIVEPAGNSFENSKGMNELSYMVCYDEKNQCTYYVNFGIDDYIYQRKDNETTLLIPKKVRYLQLWDNKLYFVNATGSLTTGDICCYDLSSKQLTKLVEGEMGHLYIDNDGFIFSESEYNEADGTADVYTKKLNHDAVTPVPCEAYNLYKYKDYVMQFNEHSEMVEMVNRKTGEASPLFSYEYVTAYRVYGSYVIVRDLDILLVMDLLTGTKMIYDVSTLKCYDKSLHIRDYIVKDHILYATTEISDIIVSIDLVTGTMKKVQNMNKTGSSIDELYMAGDKIFAYLDMYDKGQTKFKEVIINDQNFSFE